MEDFVAGQFSAYCPYWRQLAYSDTEDTRVLLNSDTHTITILILLKYKFVHNIKYLNKHNKHAILPHLHATATSGNIKNHHFVHNID